MIICNIQYTLFHTSKHQLFKRTFILDVQPRPLLDGIQGRRCEEDLRRGRFDEGKKGLRTGRQAGRWVGGLTKGRVRGRAGRQAGGQMDGRAEGRAGRQTGGMRSDGARREVVLCCAVLCGAARARRLSQGKAPVIPGCLKASVCLGCRSCLLRERTNDRLHLSLAFWVMG